MDASHVACVLSPSQPQQVFHVLLVAAGDPSALRQLLAECRYRVTLCTTHPLEFLVGSHTDLVLIDLEKPDHGGMQMVTAIAHSYPHIPVVVVASDDTHHSVLAAFQAGAADYLIKPVRHNELATLWQHVWRANQQHGQQQHALGTSTPLTYIPQQPCNSTLFPAHAHGHPYTAYHQQQHAFPADLAEAMIVATTPLNRKGSNEAGMGPANHNSSGASTSNQQEHSTALLSTGTKAVNCVLEGVRGAGHNISGTGVMVREGSSSDVATNFESHLRYAATTAPHHANKAQAQSVLSAGMAQPPVKVVSGAARLAAAAVAAFREKGSATLTPLQALFSAPSRAQAKSPSPDSTLIRAGYAVSHPTVAAAAAAAAAIAAMDPARVTTGSSWEELTLVAKRLQLQPVHNWHSSKPYSAPRSKTPETGDSTSLISSNPDEPVIHVPSDDLTASSRRSSLEQQNGVTAQAAAAAAPNLMQPGWADIHDNGSNSPASADVDRNGLSPQLLMPQQHSSPSCEAVDAAVPLLRGLLLRPQARRATPTTRGTDARKGSYPVCDGLPLGLLRLAAAAEQEQELLQKKHIPQVIRSGVTPRLGRRPTSRRQLDEEAAKRSADPTGANTDDDRVAYQRQTAKTVAEWQGAKGIVNTSSVDVPASGERSPPQAIPQTPLLGLHRKRSAFSGFCAPQAARLSLPSHHPIPPMQASCQAQNPHAFFPPRQASHGLSPTEGDQPRHSTKILTACSRKPEPDLEYAFAAAKRHCNPQLAAAAALHLHTTHSRPEHNPSPNHHQQHTMASDSTLAPQQNPLPIHQLSYLPPPAQLQEVYSAGMRGSAPHFSPFPPHMHSYGNIHPPSGPPSSLSVAAVAAAMQASAGGGGSNYNPSSLLNDLQLSNMMRNQDPAFSGLHLHNQQQQHNIVLHHAAAQHAAQQQHASAIHFNPGYNEQGRFAALSGLPPPPMGLDPVMQLLASLQHGPGLHHQVHPGKMFTMPSPLPPMTHPAFRLSPQSLLASLQATAGQQQHMAAAAAYGGMPPNFGKAAGGATAASAAVAAAPTSAATACFSSGRSIMTAQRMAALAKYMEKRKHRKFHKKVRYESRKRLAESRPRVRGQFVKQEAQTALTAAPQHLPRSPESGPETPATPSPTTSAPATNGSASGSPDGAATVGPSSLTPAGLGIAGFSGIMPSNLGPAGAAVAAAALSTFLKNISRLSALPTSGAATQGTTTFQAPNNFPGPTAAMHTPLGASAMPAQAAGLSIAALLQASGATAPSSNTVNVGCSVQAGVVAAGDGAYSDAEDDEDSDEEGVAGQDSDEEE